MLELILELAFRLLFEIVLQVVGEIGLESWQTVTGRENHPPRWAAFGYAVLGACVGALSVLVWPERLVAGYRIPGASLVLGPLVSGYLMAMWGMVRRASGHSTTNFATWYGGAAFAFGVAALRFALMD